MRTYWLEINGRKVGGEDFDRDLVERLGREHIAQGSEVIIASNDGLRQPLRF